MNIFEISIMAMFFLAALWVISKNIKKMYRGEGCSSCSMNCKNRERCEQKDTI
jgi:hypothetical protein